MTAISPELALVDPDLAAAAGALLHAPGEFRPAWRTGQSVPAVGHVTVGPAEELDRIGFSRRLRQGAVLVGCSGALALGIVTGLRQIPLDRARDPSATMSALQTRALQQVRAAQTYEWPSVPGAQTYQVVLSRAGRIVYSGVTSEPTTALPPDLRLTPGRYMWTATPRFGRRGDTSPSRPVVEESFVVKPA